MRLLTRSDFDGLACGALLTHLGLIDDLLFVHPKDIQDGKIIATSNDILANIPYIPNCGLWFDHHSSESERLDFAITFQGISRQADSAARLIYDYYGGEKIFPHLKEMIDYVDRVDSGKLTKDEILNPTGWILLGFIMDPRTGLGRYRNFRISNYDLMKQLLYLCNETRISDILTNYDVQERVSLYFSQNEIFKDMIKKHTTVYKNVILTDLRGVEEIYTGNRFLIYSLYPEQNISVWVVDGKNKQNCSIAVGYSILNRSATVDVGSLLLKFGGGGHKQVGTCQVPYDDANEVMQKIIEACNK